MNARSYQKSFAGGEIAPEMFGRIDDVKYQNGAAKLRNFVVKPQGAAKFRPGLEYRASTNRPGDDRTTKSRLIPFSFSLTQAVVLEFRAWDENAAPGRYGTMRIHSDAGIQTYAASTPYINGISISFSNVGGTLQVTSGSWTGTPPDTPPFINNERITFRSVATGGLPTGIVNSQTSQSAESIYYVRNVTTTGFQISTTENGPSIAAPVYLGVNGTQFVDKYYPIGSVVTFGSPSSTYLAQRDVYVSLLSQFPTQQNETGYWFLQQSAFLELRHTYTEAELFELTYTQSFDVITLAHPNHPVREIRRFGVNRWGLVPSAFNDTAAPQNVTVTSDYGLGLIVNYIAYEDVADGSNGSSTTAVLYSQDGVPPLTAGELVYVRAPGFPYINNRFCTVDVNTTPI
ncbi:MAG: hypothetical protein ACK5S6_02560, partial [bacterium]